MRNLAVKVPTDLWPEFKARASACYQAPSRAIARDLAKGMRTDYGTLLPSAVACFEDDFEACIAHLRLPLRTGARPGPPISSSASSARSGDGSRSSPTASASSSCSARLCVRRSAGAACASPSSSFVRSPPSERTSTPSTRLPSLDQTGRPRHAFPADRRLDPAHQAGHPAWFLSTALRALDPKREPGGGGPRNGGCDGPRWHFPGRLKDWEEIHSRKPLTGTVEEIAAVYEVTVEAVLAWLRAGMPYVTPGDWHTGEGFVLRF